MEIRYIKKEEIEQLISLLSSVFLVKTSVNTILDNIDDNCDFLIAKKDEQIIGSILITKRFNFVENIISYHLDNICVLEKYRNQQVATSMLKYIDEMAIKNNIDYIEMTSSESRTIARHVYLKNNYIIRDSSIFRKNIKNNQVF